MRLALRGIFSKLRGWYEQCPTWIRQVFISPRTVSSDRLTWGVRPEKAGVMTPVYFLPLWQYVILHCSNIRHSNISTDRRPPTPPPLTLTWPTSAQYWHRPPTRRSRHRSGVRECSAIVYSPAQHSLDSLTSPCQLLREHSNYRRNVLPDIFPAETYKRGPLGRPDGEERRVRQRHCLETWALLWRFSLGQLWVEIVNRTLQIFLTENVPFAGSNIVGVWLFDWLCVVLTDGQ